MPTGAGMFWDQSSDMPTSCLVFQNLIFSYKCTFISGTVHHRTMKLFTVCFGQYLRTYWHFWRSQINKQGIYIHFLYVKYVEKYWFKEKIVKNKFLLLSAWLNVTVVRNSASACLQNFVIISWTFPEK
jgi:hypothetical protein